MSKYFKTPPPPHTSTSLPRHFSTSLLLYFFTSLLFLAPTAHAQSLELSINPPLVRVNIKPGKTITQAFNISYSGARPKNFIAAVVPFRSDDTTNIPILLWNAKPHWLTYFTLANSNISFNKPFTLTPGQKDQLVVSLKIPEDQKETEVYASIVFLSEEASISQKSQAVGGIGANLIASITNTYPPNSSLTLKTFKPTTKPLIHFDKYYIFDNLTPIEFTAIAENTGSHAGLISGDFTIKTDKILQKQTLQSGYILADSQKTLLASAGAALKATPHITNIGIATAIINVQTETSDTSGDFKIILIPVRAILATMIAFTIAYFVLKKINKEGSSNPSQYQ